MAKHQRQRLHAEPLEDRRLLSLSALTANSDAQQVLIDTGGLEATQHKLAADFDGDFVVAWVSQGDIYAQLLDRNGVVMRDTFRVNEVPNGALSAPTVAMDADGDFVVAWQGPGPEYGSGTDIYARRFNSVGVAQGVDFRVNSNITNPQFTPSVAMDVVGDFVVTWANQGQDASFFNHVSAQRYDRFGNPVGAEFVVNSPTTEIHRNPDIDLGRDGRFVITWERGPDVYAKLYNADATLIRDEWQIVPNPASDGTEWVTSQPSVDFDSAGNFFVAYTRGSFDVEDADGQFAFFSNYMQAFDAAGTLLTFPDDIGLGMGYEFQLDNLSIDPQPNLRPDGFDGFNVFYGTQTRPTISTDADGDTIVAQDGYGQDGSRGFFPIAGQQPVLPVAGDPNGALIAQFAASPLPGGEFNNFNVLISDSYVNTNVDHINDATIIRVQDVDFGDGFGPVMYGGSFTLEMLVSVQSATPGFSTTISEELAAIMLPENMNDWPQTIQDAILALNIANYDENMTYANSPVRVSIVTPASPDFKNGFFNFRIDYQDGWHDRWINFNILDNQLEATAEPLDEGTEPAEPMPVNLMIEHGFKSAGQQIKRSDVEGTYQWNHQVEVQPDGDFISVWGEFPTNELYYRRFDELTDTAGPIVTDLMTVDNLSVSDGDFIFDPVQKMTVVFDEQMAASTVQNPANWAINRLDGDSPQQIYGGITKIEYGLNKSFELGLSPTPTNKWEAVVTFDGNGPLPGVTPLQDGVYELVGTTALRDRSLNALARTGFVPAGEQFARGFRVQLPDGDESRVNSTVPGNQATESPQTIAGDADGDFAIVWTSDGQDGDGLGVFAQLYNADRTPRGPEFQVNSTTAGDQDYPSIAMDSDGDFVVTWTSFNDETLWDIYAQRYDSGGNPIGDEFLVNTETESIQRYSTVALDNDGDFVITWQSYGQDESGYGVYAQRYSREGYRVGGANEIQLLTIGGVPTGGTFKLDLGGNTTDEITFTVDDDGEGTAENIRQALAPFANVVVTPVIPFVPVGPGEEQDPVTVTDYRITFVEEDGSTDQPEMTIAEENITGSGISVEIDTVTEGTTGEFLANQTTGNNQTRPSVSAAANGEFVITWESGGQFGDAVNRTNIVARRFASNDAIDDFGFSGRGDFIIGMSSRSFDEALNNVAPESVQPRIVTTGDPADYVVTTGQGFDGVVALEYPAFGNFEFCTGSLLLTGQHILTAAHCVAGLAPEDVVIRFDLPSGPVRLGVSEILVHPGYSNYAEGNDIAVLTLSSFAPSAAERYDIYRGSDEVGKVSTKVGYGRHGTGTEGDTDSDGRKRSGQNIYDAVGDILVGTQYDFGQILGTQLAYDFDNGDAQNDFFGQEFGIGDTGLGDNEVTSAPGDSGGPTFIDGLIAGVTSYGFGGSGFVPTDVDEFLNSSFGEASVDARVSTYATFIDTATGGATGAFPLGPEFLVNDLALPTNQTRPDVAVDLDGDFVITWTSYGQEDGLYGSAYGFVVQNGVFARRFTADGEGVASEFQVNEVTKFDQQNSRVAVDAEGDFFIVWESLQDVNSTNTSGEPDDFGIFARAYAPSMNGAGPNGEFGLPTRMNQTIDGDQRLAGVTSDHDGAVVYTWSGNGEQPGEQDDQGVFLRRFDAISRTAGPIVTEVLPFDNDTLIVRFSEDLNTISTLAPESITNVLNWAISRNNLEIDEAVADVEFGLDKAFELGLTDRELFKYEAVVELSAPLQTNLEYLLTVQDFVEDVDGNRLDGNYDGEPGGDFNGVFVIKGDEGTGPGFIGPIGPEIPVNTTTENNQRDSAVAVAPDGSFVVVWTSVSSGQGDVLAQRFDAAGNTVGGEFTINQVTVGNQDLSQIAMNDDGTFLVVWEGNGVGDSSGIFGRRFAADGTPLGSQFTVNTTVSGLQKNSSVALDANGDFIVAWSDYGYPGNGAVRARRFNASAVGQGNDFLVTTTGLTSPSVAADAAGNFVVVWSRFDAINGFDVYAQLYDSNGNANGVPLPVNDYKTANQTGSKVGMDDNGNFVVVWNSFQQDGFGYGVYGRRFNAAGVKLGDEFRANTETFGDQYQADVHMDGIGNFTIVWTGEYADDDGLGVLVRRYTADGAPLGVEEVVNTTTAEDQFKPAVGANDLGRAVITWTGDDDDLLTDFTDVFAQRYNFGSAASGSVPSVTQVILAGASTTHSDYHVPSGNGNQLLTIPVGGVDEIKIVFSQDVNVTQNDLSVVGVTHGTYSFSGFSYDSGSRTATWTVNGLAQGDAITLTLSDNVNAKVGGRLLDGEWDNPTSLADASSSTFPSGNGAQGGNFIFKFRVLPGDANQDSVVNGLDYIVWAQHSDTVGGAQFTDADFNGDGNVNGLDYIEWATHVDTNQNSQSLVAEFDALDFGSLYLDFAANFDSYVTPNTSGDYDGDGHVSSLDYLLLVRSLGNIQSFGSEAPVTVSSYAETGSTLLPVSSTEAAVDQLFVDLDIESEEDSVLDEDVDWFDMHTDAIDELALSAAIDLLDE
ncbi:MAG: trypsin-like serine protease [Pirellulales bacterium]